MTYLLPRNNVTVFGSEFQFLTVGVGIDQVTIVEKCLEKIWPLEDLGMLLFHLIG